MKVLLVTLFISGFAWAQTAIKMQTPLREISVIATEDGFYPKQISVHEGEKVRFFVTSTKAEPDCFVINGHKVFLAAKQGKISEGEAVFNEPGRFRFYCPSSKFSGHVTVIDKVNLIDSPSPSLQKKSRSLAGDYDDEGPVPSIWVPKDY